MPFKDEDYFTFTWHVKNFSMCPVKRGECISSPYIKLAFLQDSEWRLKLYPKGYNNREPEQCYLRCEHFGKCNGNLDVKYKLSIFDDVCDTEEGQFNTRNRESKPLLLNLDHIFKNRNHYLPNDTLTIICKLTNSDDDAISEEEMRALTHMRFNVTKEKNLFDSKKCCVETIVEVHRKKVIWPIRRFQTLLIGEELKMPVISTVEDVPSFYVTFFKGETESLTNMNIAIYSIDIGDNVFVKCNASVIDNQKRVMRSVKDEFLFESDERWRYPTFVNLKELDGDKYFERTDDTLYICLDIGFSVEGKLHHLEQNYCEPIKMPTSSSFSLSEYRMLAPYEEPSIIRLQTGDHTYEVHRRTLIANSEVFETMFRNEMKEKESGVVVIPDVDPDTLGRLLRFCYSNVIYDLPLDDLIKLYCAAHKYQILSLLIHCSFVLESFLDLSNVTGILSLADLHKDEQLLEGTEVFIRANLNRVLVSKDWKDLMKNNGTLAANVMHKMLINS